MSSALKRGRTLNKKAVAQARKWREERINCLRDRVQDGSITFKERRELKWKWGLEPNPQGEQRS